MDAVKKAKWKSNGENLLASIWKFANAIQSLEETVGYSQAHGTFAGGSTKQKVIEPDY